MVEVPGRRTGYPIRPIRAWNSWIGPQDFELDLLFYHRVLQCLVAFELKTGRFEPEHMGKLSFDLEAPRDPDGGEEIL